MQARFCADSGIHMRSDISGTEESRLETLISYNLFFNLVKMSALEEF